MQKYWLFALARYAPESEGDERVFQIKVEYHYNFNGVNLDGFVWNFLNLIIDTFCLSRTNFMIIGLTVKKPSAEMCRSSCTLINNSMHVKVMAAYLDKKVN